MKVMTKITPTAAPAKKKYNYTKKTGRPSDYNPAYCQMIIDFFGNHKLKEEVSKIDKDGTETFKMVTNDYPTFNDFAKKLKVNYISLGRWCNAHDEFSIAYKRAKELQSELIIKGALIGVYNSTFSIFAMKNIAGWRDKSEVEHSGSISWEGLINDLSGSEARNTRQMQSLTNN